MRPKLPTWPQFLVKFIINKVETKYNVDVGPPLQILLVELASKVAEQLEIFSRKEKKYWEKQQHRLKLHTFFLKATLVINKC